MGEYSDNIGLVKPSNWDEFEKFTKDAVLREIVDFDLPNRIEDTIYNITCIAGVKAGEAVAGMIGEFLGHMMVKQLTKQSYDAMLKFIQKTVVASATAATGPAAGAAIDEIIDYTKKQNKKYLAAQKKELANYVDEKVGVYAAKAGNTLMTPFGQIAGEMAGKAAADRFINNRIAPQVDKILRDKLPLPPKSEPIEDLPFHLTERFQPEFNERFLARVGGNLAIGFAKNLADKKLFNPMLKQLKEDLTEKGIPEAVVNRFIDGGRLTPEEMSLLRSQAANVMVAFGGIIYGGAKRIQEGLTRTPTEEEKHEVRSKLYTACEKGDIKLLREAIIPFEADDFEDSVDWYPWHITPQEYAVDELQQGILIHNHKTPMMLAIDIPDNDDMIELLIENQAPLEQRYDGLTPAMYAVLQGNLNALKTLSNHGADLGAKTSAEFASLLHLAANKGDMDMVQYLIDQGGNVNIITRTGQTPLHCAMANGHTEVAQLLLENGAALLPMDINFNTPLDFLEPQNRENLESWLLDVDNFERILQLCFSEQPGIDGLNTFLFLTNTGIMGKISNKYPEVIQAYQEDFLKLAQQFINNKSFINCFTSTLQKDEMLNQNIFPKESLTVLFDTAFDKKAYSICNYLLTDNQLNFSQSQFQELFDKALHNGRYPICDQLLEDNRINPLHLDDQDQLLITVMNKQRGCPDKTMQLIEQKSHDALERFIQENMDKDIDIPLGPNNQSLLHILIQNKRFDDAKRLIENGANVEAVNKEGKTVLITLENISEPGGLLTNFIDFIGMTSAERTNAKNLLKFINEKIEADKDTGNIITADNTQQLEESVEDNFDNTIPSDNNVTDDIIAETRFSEKDTNNDMLDNIIDSITDITQEDLNADVNEQSTNRNIPDTDVHSNLKENQDLNFIQNQNVDAYINRVDQEIERLENSKNIFKRKQSDTIKSGKIEALKSLRKGMTQFKNNNNQSIAEYVNNWKNDINQVSNKSNLETLQEQRLWIKRSITKSEDFVNQLSNDIKEDINFFDVITDEQALVKDSIDTMKELITIIECGEYNDHVVKLIEEVHNNLQFAHKVAKTALTNQVQGNIDNRQYKNIKNTIESSIENYKNNVLIPFITSCMGANKNLDEFFWKAATDLKKSDEEFKEINAKIPALKTIAEYKAPKKELSNANIEKIQQIESKIDKFKNFKEKYGKINITLKSTPPADRVKF